MDAFYWYYNNVLPHTRYLLYAYSKVWPSAEIVQVCMCGGREGGGDVRLYVCLPRFCSVSTYPLNPKS